MQAMLCQKLPPGKFQTSLFVCYNVETLDNSIEHIHELTG